MKLKDHLSKSEANTLPDILRRLDIGQLLRGQLPQALRRRVPAASAYQLATVEALTLADDGKASVVTRATVRTGGVIGELTPVAYGTTPTTGEIAVAPNGDIVVLAADAITDLDVDYLPERGDVFETTMPVISDVLSFPTSLTDSPRGIVLLLEAEAVEATSTGKKIILIPGGAPAAGQCALTDDEKLSVTFAAADAVTRARVKVLLCASKDLDVRLEETATV